MSYPFRKGINPSLSRAAKTDCTLMDIEPNIPLLNNAHYIAILCVQWARNNKCQIL